MNPIVIPIDGVFDTPAASALRKRLAKMTRAGPILLDFSRARDVHDFALAVIAHGLAADGTAARYRGLTHNQERMLHYLGFATSP
jgi:anti-anti-sigma regulatory factor